MIFIYSGLLEFIHTKARKLNRLRFLMSQRCRALFKLYAIFMNAEAENPIDPHFPRPLTPLFESHLNRPHYILMKDGRIHFGVIFGIHDRAYVSHNGAPSQTAAFQDVTS